MNTCKSGGGRGLQPKGDPPSGRGCGPVVLCVLTSRLGRIRLGERNFSPPLVKPLKSRQNRPETRKSCQNGQNAQIRQGCLPIDRSHPLGRSGCPAAPPPASLQGPERQAFLDVVLSCPAAQFRPADLPLLCRWAELTVMCEVAAAEMAAQGMVTADGKVSSWFSIYERSTKALAGLALRLRLGPQSRAFKAPKKDAGPASFYDRMTLLEGDDDGDEAEAEADNKAQ
jgi:hypothetical protein